MSRLRWDSDDDYDEALPFTGRFTAGDPTLLLERFAYLMPGWTFERSWDDGNESVTWAATLDVDNITIA